MTGYEGSIANDARNDAGDYVVVNTRAEIGWRGVTLFALANNLLDEDYYISRDPAFDTAVIGAPRTLGVGLRVAF